MNRLPRLASRAALACALSFPAFLTQRVFAAPATARAAATGGGAPATAPAAGGTTQPAPGGAAAEGVPATDASAEAAGTEGAASQPASPQEALRNAVEDFWHYAKIARYDLANGAAKRIQSLNAAPLDVRNAFYATAADRKDNLDKWLATWAGVDELRDNVSKLTQLIRGGDRAQAQNQNFIEQQIRDLSRNERAYALGLARLRDSGEIAVPLMVDYLRDPNKAQFHDSIRRALQDMGRLVLNPLVASTEMNDPNTLVVIVSVLGNLGYDVVVPYLTRLEAMTDTNPAVREAVGAALRHMGAETRNANAADSFYDLGERFYYGTSSITPDPRSPVAYVWHWDQSKGLTKKDVPPSIFNDIMAMRSCEYALKLGNGQKDAISLWLAANNKREVDLPPGAQDPTRGKDEPSAHFWNVREGAQYLNSVLARSLKDRNAAVALKAVKSLGDIIGRANLFSGNSGTPLLDALDFGDRLVRYEAAFALASVLPQKGFPGQERVPALLGEALSQTGTANVLIVAGSDSERNRLAGALKNFGVAGGTGAQAALAEASSLPSVDVVLFAKDVKDPEIQQFLQFASRNVRLQRAAKLVVRQPGSMWSRMAVSDRSFRVTPVDDPASLEKLVSSSRAQPGGVTLDEKVATEYALRAADLIGRLADSRGQIFDLTVTETPLLAALSDKRPKVAQAAGNALQRMDSKQAQSALLDRALGGGTPDETKVSFFKSIASSAKNFGNRLQGQQVDSLQKVAMGDKSPDIRSAAAEAVGALNLPNDQAKRLIVEQSRQ